MSRRIPAPRSSPMAAQKKRPARNGFLRRPYPKPLHGVDLVVDLRRADLLRVLGHDGIGELLHLRAVGERDLLELARLLERVELGGILARLEVAAEDAGFL